MMSLPISQDCKVIIELLDFIELPKAMVTDSCGNSWLKNPFNHKKKIKVTGILINEKLAVWKID